MQFVTRILMLCSPRMLQHTNRMLVCETPLIDGKYISQIGIFSFPLSINMGLCGNMTCVTISLQSQSRLRNVSFSLFRQYC